jgi:hypothetical protein
MVLQACIDDSGNESGDPLFVLAGFIAPCEAWASFSDDWRKALDEPPGLAYFKMREAERLQDEFDRRKGWTERMRDDRLIAFVRLIQRYVSFRVHVSVRHDLFAKYIKTLKTPIRRSISNNPYYLLFSQLILTTAAVRMSLGMSEPVDFYFDEQGSLGDDAVFYWDNFMRLSVTASNTNFGPYLGRKPKFEDEKGFMPLQAADLYAWQLRRHMEDNMRQIIVLPRIPLAIISQISPIGFDFGENQLKLLGDNLSSFAEQYAKQNPDSPLLGPKGARVETFRGTVKRKQRQRAKKSRRGREEGASDEVS